MSKTPVAILMPTYSPNPRHLRDAVESVLAQAQREWTLLIHDDASKEDVRAIVEQYLGDERIAFERSEKRLGIGGNWNACLRKTNAPFIQYLFQDDRWHPQYLSRALEVMHQYPQVGFVSVDHHYVYEGEMPTRNAFEDLLAFKHKNVKPGLYKGHEFLRWWIERGLHPNVIGEPSFVMIRRSAIDRAGSFCEDMPQFLDVEMWIRLLLVCDWYNLPDNLGDFRVHASAASAKNEESGAGIYDRLRCFERLIAQLDGAEKTLAVRARNDAVHRMAEKFFDRMSHGKKVAGKGGGAMKAFAVRHPFLVTSALAHALWKRAVSFRLNP